MVDRGVHIQCLGVSNRLGNRPVAERRQVLANFLRDELEEVDHELGLAREALPQLRILGGDAHRTRIQMADAHHHAAADDQRSAGEAELLGAEQRGDHHVAPGLELAVALHDDAVAQAVLEECLLRLGDTELPRGARVLDRRQRRGAGATVVSGDEHHVTARLGHARGDGADADLGDQFYVDACARIGIFQVVDELLDVFDGIDVVVGRRGDQPDARSGVPRAGDPRVHLVAGQLAALAGLGALRHLDLQVVGVHEVFGCDTEAAGGDLFDGGAAPVAVGVRRVAVCVFTTLTRVGLAADTVHGNGQRFVCFPRDGAIGHRPAGEAFDDLADGFDFIDRDWLSQPFAEGEHAAQGGKSARLIVDQAGVFLDRRRSAWHVWRAGV